MPISSKYLNNPGYSLPHFLSPSSCQVGSRWFHRVQTSVICFLSLISFSPKLAFTGHVTHPVCSLQSFGKGHPLLSPKLNYKDNTKGEERDSQLHKWKGRRKHSRVTFAQTWVDVAATHTEMPKPPLIFIAMDPADCSESSILCLTGQPPQVCLPTVESYPKVTGARRVCKPVSS